MKQQSHTMIIESYCRSHGKISAFISRLSEDQLFWQLNENKLCIAWHGWHLARWADFFQASVSGMRPELLKKLGAGSQIWEEEKLKEAWGWDGLVLGYAETGMDMPDTIASSLKFPKRRDFADYLERVIMLAEQAVKQIDEDIFWSIEQPQKMTEGIYEEGTVGNAVMAHVLHINRHLGMMEALLGLQTISGTASR